MARPDHLARRRGALHALPPRRRRGAAEGRRQDRGQEGHPGHLPAQPRDVQDHRVRLRAARAPLPRARLPQLGRAPDPRRRAPRRARARSSSITRAGSPPSSNISTAPRRRCCPSRSPSRRSARRHRHRRRARMERQLLRERPAVHQQHPAARRRHPPGRVPRRADPHDQQLCRQVRHAEEGKGQPDRRGHARRADRDRLGQAARSQVQLARPRTSWSAPKCASRSKA